MGNNTLETQFTQTLGLQQPTVRRYYLVLPIKPHISLNTDRVPLTPPSQFSARESARNRTRGLSDITPPLQYSCRLHWIGQRTEGHELRRAEGEQRERGVLKGLGVVITGAPNLSNEAGLRAGARCVERRMEKQRACVE